MTDITSRTEAELAAIAAASSLDALEAERLETLGKKGWVSLALKTLGGMSPEERSLAAPAIQSARARVAEALDARKAALEAAALEEQLARESIAKFGIRARGPRQIVKQLSGGNQQKVVLAKWLATEPRILIMDEPTRGIDVGAKSEIHALMSSLAARGLGILMISSELPEVLGIADRLIVMRDGRISGELAREQASETAALALALPDGAPAAVH